ncbi:XRE family transcriptional regulator [Lacticaseibacillus paracasei]|uniref:XRE family transcriptional regulator n=1 Tax=Lacticaseibacillus paracasei TaxID=1597 RepID=UPI00194FC188|nr:XRE family transcriptional regulator [Lacticaseibacillus paracasei]MBM6414650.1 XRE family transcriptional regulator [Lacticaseibacillus paracasei]
MKLRDKVQALLDSDATSYAIAKETGISNSTIVELRHGKRKLSNITLKVAERLGEYYDTHQVR